MNKISLLEQITVWGKKYSKPQKIEIEIDSVLEHKNSVTFFSQRKWFELTESELCFYWDFPYYFTKESFRYFLPGIIKANLESQKFNLFYDSILAPLDLVNDITFLPTNTINQWLFLNSIELKVVLEWLIYSLDYGVTDYFGEDVVFRIISTIDKIIKTKEQSEN